jgi:hypothetical protein
MDLVLGGLAALILFFIATFIAAGTIFILLLLIASGYHNQKQEERWREYSSTTANEESRIREKSKNFFLNHRKQLSKNKQDVKNEYLYILYGKAWLITILLFLLVWLKRI